MATAEQHKLLLSIPCPYCNVGPGVECYVREPEPMVWRRRRPLRITTLDGGCHDARWRAAVGTDAPVLAEAVAALVNGEDGDRRVKRASELAPATVAVMERPW